MDPRAFLAQIMSSLPRGGTPDVALSGRQSTNVDVATPAQQAAPTLAELSGEGSKYGAPYVSNWDLLHKRHLMDQTPLAQQDIDVRTTTAPEVLSQQIQPPGAPGYIQNPGTFIPSQNRNRHLVSNADPAQLPLMPGSSSAFSGNVLPATNPPETGFRPGLRYAPWNLR